MNIWKKLIIISFSVFCLVGCDLSTKHIAQKELKGQAVQSYLGGNLKLFYIENSGGMLSIGDDLSDGLKFVIFQLFVATVLLILFIYIIRKKNLNKLQSAAFVLFLSGGLGNLIDRLMHNGKVIDFIVLEISGYRTGIFNVADFYVTIGLILLLIFSIFVRNPQAA